MKRLIFFLAIILALSACSSPTNTATTVPDATPADTTTTPETPATPSSTSVVHFYYSNWTEVTLATASSSMARSIVSKSATDLASALENEIGLGAILKLQAQFERLGYRLIHRATTLYDPARPVYDYLAVKAG